MLNGHPGRNDYDSILRIAKLESRLIDFIRETLLRDIQTFFPNASLTHIPHIFPASNNEFSFRTHDRGFFYKGLLREAEAPLTLSLIVLDEHRLQRADIIHEFSGFPVMSGISACRIQCPAKLVVNLSDIELVIRTVFATGFQWASQEFVTLVGHHFDAVGSDFYDLLNLQLLQIPLSKKRKIILSVYFHEAEYCILSAQFVRDYLEYLSSVKISKLANEPSAGVRLLSTPPIERGGHTVPSRSG
jgi:hypothetical protein